MSSTIIAGVNTSFSIISFNEYGLMIPVCPELSQYSIDIMPNISAFPDNLNISVSKCHNGVTDVKYNATTAGIFQVHVMFMDTEIFESPYQVRVWPTSIDASKTIISNMTGTDDGTFYLQVKDMYGNDEIQLGSSNFKVDLSPFCANTSVVATPQSNGLLKCDYTVNEGGIYCVVIDYLGYKIAINNSMIRATGGLGCPGSCAHQGYCFLNTSTETYSCNCFQGYIESNCTTLRTSKYPLAIGAVVGLVVGLAVLLFIIGLLLGYFVLSKLRNHHHDNRPLLSAD